MTRFRLIASVLLLVAVAMPSLSAAQEEEDSRSALGSWMLTITPPPGGPPAFKVLASFADGGVFIATTQNDHTMGAGIQQGTWHKTGDHLLSSTQLNFLYDSVGHPVGTLKIRATYSLTATGDLTGEGQLLRCDLTGANCVSLPGCSAIEGKRIHVEAPQCQ